MSQEHIEVPIRDESIRLGQLLKLSGVAENGAVARDLIEAEAVRVNGEPELRRGRQVTVGQIVDVDGEPFGLPAVRLTVTSG
ncbi:RNA-binding S4 domain-containing protein [Nesterenkonia aerolata]|uniref:RNA-binding S4 domain-containing protein n=1 Tax=Nesterenkonia aerolata TaxID=3074079 RepID=A0ABU2DPI4_9MICC|nr:RNA-binding S4 domain-containing protein [Nesterenkonia sp. LY-0111]MDR8018220.1 RNA-binding S4 domain-containing protein [Nesterenkonia sp. LY-0111]